MMRFLFLEVEFNPIQDQVRLVIEHDRSSSYDRAKARALYVRQSVLDGLLAKDTQRYAMAAQAAGGTRNTHDPIVALAERFEGSLNLTQAAAEFGLTGQRFLERLPQGRGLDVLRQRDGRVKRDAFEEQYGALVAELRLGRYVQPPIAHPPFPWSPRRTQRRLLQRLL